MLPWVPMEERFKIRNFKRYAHSEFNLSYLEEIKAVTLKLLKTQIVSFTHIRKRTILILYKK